MGKPIQDANCVTQVILYTQLMLINRNILNVRNEWCIILNACRNVNSLCTGGASPYADLGGVPTTPKVAASFLGILILPPGGLSVKS